MTELSVRSETRYDIYKREDDIDMMLIGRKLLKAHRGNLPQYCHPVVFVLMRLIIQHSAIPRLPSSRP